MPSLSEAKPLLRMLAYLAERAGIGSEALLAPGARALVGKLTKTPKMSATLARMVEREAAMTGRFNQLVDEVRDGVRPSPHLSGVGTAEMVELYEKGEVAKQFVQRRMVEEGLVPGPSSGQGKTDILNLLMRMAERQGNKNPKELLGSLKREMRAIRSSRHAVPKFDGTAKEIERKLWFHGVNGREGITPSTLENWNSRTTNLAGPGLYATDDPSIALEYATDRGPQGTVMALQANPTNLLDLDDRALAINTLRETWKKALGNYFSPSHFQTRIDRVPAALAPFEAAKYGIANVMHPEFTDLKSMWNEFLRLLADEAGYTGFRHLGGVQGGRAHNVAIFHQPEVAIDAMYPYIVRG